MTGAQLSRLVTLTSLGAGRPLAPELEGLQDPLSRRAADLAAGGQLAPALESLGFDADLAWLGARWPAALPGAVAQLSRLPSAVELQFEVMVEFVAAGLVLLTQLALGAVLARKVLPVMQHLAADAHLRVEKWGPPLLLAAVVLGVVATLALVLESRRGTFTGWTRLLGCAREATLASALSDAQAPDDVRAEHLARCATIAALPLSTPAVDLDAIATDAAARAEAAMSNVVVSGRVLLAAALALAALGFSIDMFRLLAALPGAM